MQPTATSNSASRLSDQTASEPAHSSILQQPVNQKAAEIAGRDSLLGIGSESSQESMLRVGVQQTMLQSMPQADNMKAILERTEREALLIELANHPQVVVGNMVDQKESMGKAFPLVLSSARRVNPINFIELQTFLQRHRALVLQAASEYGAVLFNGFDIRSAEEWASVLYALGLQEVAYMGGAAVRNLVVGNEQRMQDLQVLTTNESPPSEPIPFHHELAQTPNPPSHICFYCHKNAAEGGATSLIRSDDIYRWMASHLPELLQAFATHGVQYVRIVPTEDDPSSALGRSWKSMFQVNSRADAEQVMAAEGWQWEWLDNGDCKTITKTLPAIRQASNGHASFCNQVVAAYTGWQDVRNESKKSVQLGNGDTLPAEQMDQLLDYIQQNQFQSAWQPGQFVIVDNSVAAHSRQTFNGPRKVLAAIADGVKEVPSEPVSHLVLSSGDKMPSVGFGLWNVAKDSCADVVRSAIAVGYRCFDEAADYGNEQACGEGIARSIADGVVTREDLWITSKLWNTNHQPEHVEAACRQSMSDLGVERLDLYLVHFPIALKYVPPETRYPPGWLYDPEQPHLGMVEERVPLSQTWQAMEALVEKGLVKNIGLCNVGVSQLRDLMSHAKIKPSVLQVEIHPYNNQSQLLRFCRDNGVAVTGFSNLGGGSYVDLGMAKQTESCLQEPVIQDIAQQQNKSPAQVVLRWAVQRGIAIVPKSTHIERQKENFNIYDFSLSVEEMGHIDALNKNHRFNDPGQFCESAFNTFYPIYD